MVSHHIYCTTFTTSCVAASFLFVSVTYCLVVCHLLWFIKRYLIIIIQKSQCLVTNTTVVLIIGVHNALCQSERATPEAQIKTAKAQEQNVQRITEYNSKQNQSETHTSLVLWDVPKITFNY